jgi:hypothetical protein
MIAPTQPPERLRLHQWIDQLPPRQFTLIYQLVQELVEEEPDETSYLLQSEAMRTRLLAARESDEGIPFEVAREKCGTRP